MKRLDPARWLKHLATSRRRALAGDPEGVHQVRVALRRLRVWLSFKRGTRALDRELRWLGRALAPLRDLDVFGEVLTDEARRQLRKGARAEAQRALSSQRLQALLDTLGTVRGPRRRRAERALEHLEAQLEAQRGALTPGDGEQVHRVRRALRRVRYAREWLGRPAASLAVEQDRLGALCDLLALARFAERHEVRPPAPLLAALGRAFSLVEVTTP